MAAQQNSRILYVGGLADNVDEATLQAAFIPFGPIAEVNIPKDHAKGGCDSFRCWRGVTMH